MLTSVNLKEDEEPNKYYKLFWSFIFLALPVSILFLEHNVEGLNILNTIKSLTTLYAIPVLFVVTILIVSFGKVLKRDIQSGEILNSIESHKRFKWANDKAPMQDSARAK